MKLSWRWMAALALGATTQACGAAGPEEANEADDATEKVAKIALAHSWLLVGDGLTPSDAQVKATFTLPKSYKGAAVSIDAAAGAQPVTRGADGKFAVALPVGKLATG